MKNEEHQKKKPNKIISYVGNKGKYGLGSKYFNMSRQKLSWRNYLKLNIAYRWVVVGTLVVTFGSHNKTINVNIIVNNEK